MRTVIELDEGLSLILGDFEDLRQVKRDLGVLGLVLFLGFVAVLAEPFLVLWVELDLAQFLRAFESFFLDQQLDLARNGL